MRSAQEFVNRWNALASVSSINTVYIIGHGHFSQVGDALIGNLWFGHTNRGYGRSHFYAQSHGNMRPEDRSISDLRAISMGYLYFSSCNTANLDFAVNILTAFFDHNPGIATASGWDGGVGFTFFSQRQAALGFVAGALSGPPPIGINIPRGMRGARAFGHMNRDGASPWSDYSTFAQLMRCSGNTREPGMITLTR